MELPRALSISGKNGVVPTAGNDNISPLARAMTKNECKFADPLIRGRSADMSYSLLHLHCTDLTGNTSGAVHCCQPNFHLLQLPHEDPTKIKWQAAVSTVRCPSHRSLSYHPTGIDHGSSLRAVLGVLIQSLLLWQNYTSGIG